MKFILICLEMVILIFYSRNKVTLGLSSSTGFYLKTVLEFLDFLEILEIITENSDFTFDNFWEVERDDSWESF